MSTEPVTIGSWLILVGALCVGGGLSPLGAQYTFLEVPQVWRFRAPTVAYQPDGSGVRLGDFRAGLEVEVLTKDPAAAQWLVEFKRIGAANIRALIDAPDARAYDPQGGVAALASLRDFDLLEQLLAAPEPWPADRRVLANRLFPQQWAVASGTAESPELIGVRPSDQLHLDYWGLEPMAVLIDYRMKGNRKISIEFWNRGDDPSGWRQASAGLEQLRARLRAMESLFGNFQTQIERSARHELGITAVKGRSEAYFLANDVEACVRWQRGEFLTLELLSYREQSARPEANVYDPETFAETIASRVRTGEGGVVWIDGIPMISQGDKGYCAAATLARILNYYGYPVGMHEMAELGETSSARGTRIDDVIDSIRRVCNSTPFRMREVDEVRRAEVLAIIERGIPIYWIVPGHARLLIGVHPEGGIVYSDSWGPGHEYKEMSWSDFKNWNRQMWILEPSN